ncbi:CsgG/HfaB family protein [Constantimarinum furrinae]|uniref:Curli production component CsgG n=1 Tax=Constantimarinum furrinae TaxID=2562285 RepID=A0A7G8PR29_9FLAO|nr:CsgG/HfaB family protein [Constantimarinum furrinae]QNJ96795.1 Curli production component CsgG [Constantimarinum furrinae]
MIIYLRNTLLISFVLLLTGCGAYFNQPIAPQDARMAEVTNQTRKLKDLPKPLSPIVVGVYNFKDQTGQYKNIENGSTFSTAVTQGATTILIKALEDSKWFRPIERENLNNLLNERNIIRTTRDEYRKSADDPVQRLNPLLFAGILLEGGVISYDTNLMTGGVGARYFGTGGSSQYRQDRITVYLRAISTSTGEVLKTVNVSKTILSQSVDVGIFKYVNFQRLLEVETGFTKNEPTQMAVQEAIELAVHLLILEGIQDKLWTSADGEEKDKELVEEYLIEKQLEESTALYDRKYLKHDFKHAFNVSGGVALVDGDYTSGQLDYMAELGYKYRLIPELSISSRFQIFKLNSTEETNHWWLSESFNVEYNILPHDRLSPFIFAGPEILLFADDSPSLYLQRWDSFFALKFGAGLEYAVSDRVSFVLTGDFNRTFSDKIDNQPGGRRDDFFYTFGFGLNYHFGSKKSKLKTNEHF